ncbi:TrmH family RNA methyltransferase [Sulfurimonas sp.]|uniref:TrmH family RNA methyltransferase n=1 Tax=Sulfurimonas sp. TaxID=2022749 RepID=UPI003563E81B
MRLVEINDINSDELQIYHQMRDNIFDEQNSFVADSPKVVNILLESDLVVKSILATQEYYEKHVDLLKNRDNIVCYKATKEQMQNLVGHKIHHNCMLHGIRPKECSLDQLGNNIVMLDNITSSENVGSIARSMAGLGVSSYLLPKQSPHPYGRRALRVSMGYVSRLKYSIYTDIIRTIKELQDNGYKVYAAELSEDSIPLKNVKPDHKWVLVMGSEGHGISKEVLDVCDEVVNIEMQEDVKSFNVSVAASILMYEFVNSAG